MSTPLPVNTLLDNAIAELQNLEDGEYFLIRDLFRGYEWNRIPRSDRLLLGTLFLNHINTNPTKITAVEKTSAGQQKYLVDPGFPLPQSRNVR